MGCLYNKENVTAATPGLFSNVQSDGYWSSTVYAPTSYSGYGAWNFIFSTGYQHRSDTYDYYYVWPVRSGNDSAVPEP